MGNICSEGDSAAKSNTSKGPPDDEEILKTNSSIEVMERSPSSSADTVWNLTQRQQDECEEVFAVFEEDDDKADVKHIAVMMRALNYQPSPKEITSLTARSQKEHNSKMTFQIFLQIMAPRIIKANEVYAEDKIQAAFRRFDKDHNGFITASELRIALQDSFCPGMKRVAEALTDDDVQEVMNEADLNGDGKISYSEFKEMIPHLSLGIHTSVKTK